MGRRPRSTVCRRQSQPIRPMPEQLDDAAPRSAASSSAPTPTSASKRRGVGAERRARARSAARRPSILIGQPTSRSVPNTGCATSTTISRASACSSASASSTVYTGATGTWPRSRSSHSAVVRARNASSSEGTSAVRCARRSAKLRKRGRRRSAGSSSALDQALPELLLHHHDDDPAVGGPERLARHEALVRALRMARRVASRD